MPSTTAGIYLNVVTGATGITSTTQPAGWDVNPYGSTNMTMFTGTGTGTNGAALGAGMGAYVGTGTTWFNLALGTIIGPGSTFAGTGGVNPSATTPLNLNGLVNYVGFRFRNEATGAINYGYLQLSMAGTAGGQPRSIIGYAYENNGGSIAVGGVAVPEPSTYALFSVVAGAFGLRAWRKRKAA